MKKKRSLIGTQVDSLLGYIHFNRQALNEQNCRYAQHCGPFWTTCFLSWQNEKLTFLFSPCFKFSIKPLPFLVLILVLQIDCRIVKGIISNSVFCITISPHFSAYFSALSKVSAHKISPSLCSACSRVHYWCSVNTKLS